MDASSNARENPVDFSQVEMDSEFDGRLSYFRFTEDVVCELACVNMTLRNCQCWDLFIRGFLALFSGGGVVSWFYLGKYAVFGSIAVAVSQLVSLLLPFFNLRQKIERLLLVSEEMQELADDLQNAWPDVQGAMQDDEPLRLMRLARERQRKAMGRLRGLVSFSDRLAGKAEERANRYIRLHFYNG